MFFNDTTIKDDLDRIENEIISLSTQLNDARSEEYEIGTVVEYATQFMKNPLDIWKKSSVENKKQIQ